jgi:tetratricopeptide (TPR) repeat protein
MRNRLPAALVALVILLPGVALACLWDYDTLAAERSRFPSVLELLTGKFLRHSPEFYEWRVKDRLAKLEREPENLAYLDDLAVAYDKLGKQDLAIELMERKERLKPGMYETAANHGTFLAHSGRLAEALPLLQKAIAINPNAHFGREIYQIKLIEHSLRGAPDQSFVDFLRKEPGFEPFNRAAAVKGVLGIMRFGNHENPKVLAALGSLLTYENHHEVYEDVEDAKALAARAYLRAAALTQNAPAKAEALRQRAKDAIQHQVPADLDDLERSFEKELADGATWYADLHQRELAWITAGADVDAEFTKLYQQEPRTQVERHLEVNLTHAQHEHRQALSILGTLLGLLVAGLVAIVAVVFAIRWAIRRDAQLNQRFEDPPTG